MKKAIIWHNPRCSKSRQTLALLEEACEDKKIEIQIVKYLEDIPSLSTLKKTLKLLEMKASDLIRNKEAVYKELELKNATEADLLKAMQAHPKLIERPIVFFEDQAILGRPPENVNLLFK